MDLVRQSLSITLVFAFLFTVLWLLKRRGTIRIRGNPPSRGSLESCGKLSLTAQHSIHLVRVGGRSMVLAVHPAGITFLCEAAATPPREAQGPAIP
ncbi:MAG TPA: flagellar biosynthetic protein FliO [Bryobacteraceae bacterium]|nr:flagellar biosynthetic protein FliO [Bryobacteraceae bacterium]